MRGGKTIHDISVVGRSGSIFGMTPGSLGEFGPERRPSHPDIPSTTSTLSVNVSFHEKVSDPLQLYLLWLMYKALPSAQYRREGMPLTHDMSPKIST